MAKFNIIYNHLPGGSKGNHERPQSGKSISVPGIEPEISRIWSAKHSAATFDSRREEDINISKMHHKDAKGF
jgi:hypothetical protein